eukprot:TRINITY_DN23372_c0_g1_i1.p1 TRINITY_DN23372_c0_g1~~TRINITY_DN23372_c0_g1_i1.p1  ORF type:complete len:664 (+),score=98.36 TRINITY_DN23372_c0_g1_i1:935-2926(+)
MSPTSTSMALVGDLLKEIEAISLLGEVAMSQKKNSWNLTRLCKLLAPLFEEIMEVKSPLPALAVVKFQELRTAFQKARNLMEDCRDGSKVFMIMERKAMAQRFTDLSEDFTNALQDLPLPLLAVSEEIMEQVGLVVKQLKRIRNMEDASEEQLETDIKALLEDAAQGAHDPAMLDPIIGKLGITSLPGANRELRALFEEKKLKLADNDLASVHTLNKAIKLLRSLRVSLGGIDQGQDEAELAKELEKSGGPGTLAAMLAAKVAAGPAGGPSPPEDFRCPISLELMRDPVIVSTGMTYDRQYIEQWLKEGHKTCPKTQQLLPHPTLIPNYSLRSLIVHWCEVNGVELPKKPSRRSIDTVARMAAQTKEGQMDAAYETADRSVLLHLRDQLHMGDMDIQRSAAEEFRKLAKRSSGNRIAIAQAGIVPYLVMALKYPDEKTQEHAVTALLNLSIHDTNKAAIVAAGAIEPIVSVLRSGNQEARENAAASLFSLSVIDENKISIGQSGAIPALVNLLQNGSSRGKKDAATALFNLSIYQGNKARAVRAGIVEPLMELLRNRQLGMVDEALAILAILATALEGRTAIGQAKAVPVLVGLIGNGSPRNKENSASVLLSLCTNGTDHTETAIQLDAQTPLGALLRNGTPRAKRKASLLLQHLAEHLSAPS